MNLKIIIITLKNFHIFKRFSKVIFVQTYKYLPNAKYFGNVSWKSDFLDYKNFWLLIDIDDIIFYLPNQVFINTLAGGFFEWNLHFFAFLGIISPSIGIGCTLGPFFANSAWWASGNPRIFLWDEEKKSDYLIDKVCKR